MPKESPYTSLSETVALLGSDAKRRLQQSHVEGRLTLIGRRRAGSGWGPDEAIPRETFAAEVRLNLEENSIEPASRSESTRGINGRGESWEHDEATAEDFREFEHAARSSIWGYLKVATHELRALRMSPNGRAASLAKDQRLQSAIQHRLDAGVVPGATTPWKDFCKQIRDDCDGWKDQRRKEPKLGYGDKTIKRAFEKTPKAPSR